MEDIDPIVAEVSTENFHAVSEMKRIFITSGEKTKNGKDRKFPVFIRSIQLHCKRSGNSFKFPMQVRQNVVSFGDSRQNEKSFGGFKTRFNIEAMESELARMVGVDNAKTLVGSLL